MVELDDGLRVATPAWMLDEVWCRAMRLEERPRISVAALLLLRDLVDLQVTSPGDNNSVSGFMEVKGDCHEPIND